MAPAGVFRDVVVPAGPAPEVAEGNSYVMAIGIDRYQAWNRLGNAVSDATGALDVFRRLGFRPPRPPLFDEAATGDALRRLVSDELSVLEPEDRLVVFFAGHGHTLTRSFPDRTVLKTGYLVPVDGAPPGGQVASWIRLDAWLNELTQLPPRHILVVLDACHSGIALSPVVRWRGEGGRAEPLAQLRARRSRRIITSALDDQLAMDSGPVAGHSLFTGCLIEALTGYVPDPTGSGIVTGSEIGSYVQRRVSSFPRSAQTPDFGALELDDRGELVVRLAAAPMVAAPVVAAPEVVAPVVAAPVVAAPVVAAPVVAAPVTEPGRVAAPVLESRPWGGSRSLVAGATMIAAIALAGVALPGIDVTFGLTLVLAGAFAIHALLGARDDLWLALRAGLGLALASLVVLDIRHARALDTQLGTSVSSGESAAGMVAALLSLPLIFKLVGPQLTRWRSPVDRRAASDPAMELAMVQWFLALSAIAAGSVLVVLHLTRRHGA